MRFGGYQTPTSILNLSGAVFGEALKENLGDGINFFLDGDITKYGYATDDLITLTESGELTFCYMSTNYFSGELPQVNIFDLPFVYNDRHKAQAMLDSVIGEHIRQVIERAHPKLMVLQFWDNGYRHFSNRIRPIREPKDCEGIRTRTLPSKFHRRIHQCLGFTPAAMNIKQFIAEIDTGDIDGQDNPLTNIYHFNIHKYHRYITLTGHIWGVCGLYCNRELYESWSPKVRNAVDDAALEAARFQRKLAAEEDKKLLSKFDSSENEIIHLSNEERQKFIATVTPIIDEQRAIVGDDLFDLVMNETTDRC